MDVTFLISPWDGIVIRTMSDLHPWDYWIYVTLSVALIMLMADLLDYDVLDGFTKGCASGYQDWCCIMMLFHDYLEMCVEIALCTISILH